MPGRAALRRRADRLEWQRIIARRLAVTRLETTAFTGAVTLLLLDEFGEPFYAQVDEHSCCVAATGRQGYDGICQVMRYRNGVPLVMYRCIVHAQ